MRQPSAPEEEETITVTIKGEIQISLDKEQLAQLRRILTGRQE